jgi:hypothetical protein
LTNVNRIRFLDDENCKIADALASGLPDVSITGGWNHYTISGTTQSGITQHDGEYSYFLGSLSSTSNGISYYIDGDDIHCNKPRISQIAWKCGSRHLQVISSSEPVECEYHFEVEIDCCYGIYQSHI